MRTILNASSIAVIVASYSSRVVVETRASGLPVAGLYVVMDSPLPPQLPLKLPGLSSFKPSSARNCEPTWMVRQHLQSVQFVATPLHAFAMPHGAMPPTKHTGEPPNGTRGAMQRANTHRVVLERQCLR